MQYYSYLKNKNKKLMSVFTVVPEKEFSNYDIQVPGDFILDASEIERNFQQIEFSIKSPQVGRLSNDSVNIIEHTVKESRESSTLKETVASSEVQPKTEEIVQEKSQLNVEPSPLIPTPTARKPSKKLPTVNNKYNMCAKYLFFFFLTLIISFS